MRSYRSRLNGPFHTAIPSKGLAVAIYIYIATHRSRLNGHCLVGSRCKGVALSYSYCYAQIASGHNRVAWGIPMVFLWSSVGFAKPVLWFYHLKGVAVAMAIAIAQFASERTLSHVFTICRSSCSYT